MSEPMTAPASGAAMLTLTEVSKRLGISMPTLQRYKKGYQDRIPSEGSGRQQRYPESALAVFEAIREESEGRRGRPRKAAKATKGPAKERKKAAGKGAKRSAKSVVKSAASAPEAAAKGVEAKGKKRRGKASASGKAPKAARAAAKAAAKAGAKRGEGKKLAKAAGAATVTAVKPAPRGKPAKSGKGGKAAKGNKVAKANKPDATAKAGKGAGKLLTLAAIGDVTGISGPTLQRYIKRFTDQIPVVGSGRAKRYPQAAIEVFNRLRNESKRGPKAGLKKLAGTAVKAARGVVGQVEGGLAKRLAAIEKIAAGLQKQLDAIRKEIGKPIKVTINRG